MILRPLWTLPTSLLYILLISPRILADDGQPFNCQVTTDGLDFDLTSLAGEHVVNQTRETPPSSMIDSLRFDLCHDLKKLEGIAERDQCSSDTRACLTITNRKMDEKDRIVSVIPVLQTPPLNLTLKIGSSSSQFISIISQGPNPTSSTSQPQTMNITVFCSSGEPSDPIFKSYDGSQVRVEWDAPAGCPLRKEDDNPKDGGGDTGGEGSKDEKGGSSGISWFFLVLIIAFAAYFGLGAYYNYSTYGARGADLIPHRDFWKEVPYMFTDVVSHLCSTVRPRHPASRGYIAV